MFKSIRAIDESFEENIKDFLGDNLSYPLYIVDSVKTGLIYDANTGNVIIDEKTKNREIPFIFHRNGDYVLILPKITNEAKRNAKYSLTKLGKTVYEITTMLSGDSLVYKSAIPIRDESNLIRQEIKENIDAVNKLKKKLEEEGIPMDLIDMDNSAVLTLLDNYLITHISDKDIISNREVILPIKMLFFFTKPLDENTMEVYGDAINYLCEMLSTMYEDSACDIMTNVVVKGEKSPNNEYNVTMETEGNSNKRIYMLAFAGIINPDIITSQISNALEEVSDEKSFEKDILDDLF